ncbi:MAG: hypothetical protein AVDCRST_MAG86-3915 [uncultured Truepera sp.]|uniref:Uncharacterized protein n=1 Tax=uncultured Truepera sp. TaxID=543023 RepID=A0A6J4VSI7_9DEIN|nr:MAG: hypothetical protein AVDCRST_MAG86-3915 [uncultured Truepera sp.]
MLLSTFGNAAIVARPHINAQAMFRGCYLVLGYVGCFFTVKSMQVR